MTEPPWKSDTAGVARTLERTVLSHPRSVAAIRWVMIGIYLVLILLPPLLPAPPPHASAFSNFRSLAQFAIWAMWWPFVSLSTLLFGRMWCGLLCPEGALASIASKYGSNQQPPRWMTAGAVPLLAFIGITIVGQLLEVDEEPDGQLLVLGGSTLLAIGVSLYYRRNWWIWCRYLCPVSLLFGVFSRLGIMYFAVNRPLLALNERNAPSGKQPCPVGIHLPVLSTNRSCLMCFRCAGYKNAIHLRLRHPGEELGRIESADPLFWEVIFLFGGAIGLPMGVFLGERFDWSGSHLVILLLGSSFCAILVLSTLTWLSGAFASRSSQMATQDRLLRFSTLGYVFTPISLFSLFLGLSQPTFEQFARAGLPSWLQLALRVALLGTGLVWSLRLVAKSRPTTERLQSRSVARLVPLSLGVLLVFGVWSFIIFA
ncbi:MAG TPA: 4Fe-4S binding protein [Polyangiaceae bacterium]